MEFYPWQEDFLSLSRNQSNVILSAPTGAGKTRVAYLWADIKGAIREKKHRVFYTVPIKALANEKYNELVNLFGEQNIGIVTGDVTVNHRAPVVLCTQEVFLRAFMKEKARVIVDEFHYIFADQGRTRAYIDSTRCRSDMFILSATLGKPEVIGKYLQKISNKDFFIYTTDFRPTKLEFTEHIFDLQNMPQKAVLVYVFNTYAADSIARIIAQKRPHQMARLIKIKRLANSYKVNTDNLQYVSSGVAVYHGKLQYNEKLFLEECVRRGLVEILISTNALGVGVNLPIEWVLFAGLRIPSIDGSRAISKTEFVQMSGRAGRPGYYNTGYVACLKHSQNPYENSEMIIKEYKKLLEQELENPVITLSTDIEAIVKGTRTIDEEINYIKRYSLPEVPDELTLEIKDKLLTIQDTISKLTADVKDILMDTYMPELSIEANVRLASRLATHTVIGVNEISSLIHGVTSYHALLATYRVAKKLKKISYVHVPDFDNLVSRIKKLDPFVLVKQENKQEEILI